MDRADIVCSESLVGKLSCEQGGAAREDFYEADIRALQPHPPLCKAKYSVPGRLGMVGKVPGGLERPLSTSGFWVTRVPGEFCDGRFGCRALWQTEWLQWQWPAGYDNAFQAVKEASITTKELLPIVLAGALWGPCWKTPR